MAERLKRIGTHLTRYGLVIVLLWIGGMKFTAYEAEGIKPLVANSPLMGWVYRAHERRRVFRRSWGWSRSPSACSSPSVRSGRRARPWAAGSRSGMFLTTLSFLITTPGLGAEPGRIPGLVGDAGAIPAQGRRAAGSVAVHGRGVAGGRRFNDFWKPMKAYWKEPGSREKRDALRSFLTYEVTKWQCSTRTS